MAGVEPSVARAGGVSYLRIPAADPARSAAFYTAVFGWTTGGEPTEPSFRDGSGHVIGHFTSDLPAAEDAGVRPYVYVESVDAAVARIEAEGGEVVNTPSAEGNLWVATFRDPAGNVVGIWQMGQRH